MEKNLSPKTAEELLSTPTTDGGTGYSIYSNLELDRLTALQNSLSVAAYMQNVIEGTVQPIAPTPKIDEILLKAIKGGFWSILRITVKRAKI